MTGSLAHRSPSPKYVNGWTQEELASQVDVSKQAVNYWELNRSEPLPANFVALANAFGIEPYLIYAGLPLNEALAQTESIGERIRILRHVNGWTQGKLATQGGVSLTQVSNWENGVVEPVSSDLIELANVFNVEVSQILYGKTIADLITDVANEDVQISNESIERLNSLPQSGTFLENGVHPVSLDALTKVIDSGVIVDPDNILLDIDGNPMAILLADGSLGLINENISQESVTFLNVMDLGKDYILHIKTGHIHIFDSATGNIIQVLDKNRNQIESYTFDEDDPEQLLYVTLSNISIPGAPDIQLEYDPEDSEASGLDIYNIYQIYCPLESAFLLFKGLT